MIDDSANPTASRPADPLREPLTEQVQGSLAHRALGRVLAHGYPVTDTVVDAEVAAMLGALGGLRARRAEYAFVTTTIQAYLANHHPGPAWRFVGAEVRLPNSIADFVFEALLGERPRVLVDELKTTPYWRSLALADTRSQFARLFDDARGRWGDRLLGVRLVAPALRLTALIAEPIDLTLIPESTR